MRAYLREPIVIPCGVHTASDNVDIKIMRLSDGFWLDFADATFKNSGWTDDAGDTTEDSNLLWRYAWTTPEAVDKYSIKIENITSGYSYLSENTIEVYGGTIFTVVTDGGNSTTQVKTDLVQTVNDFWSKPTLVKYLTGALAGETRQLAASSAYVGATKILVVGAAFRSIPADGVRGVLVNE